MPNIENVVNGVVGVDSGGTFNKVVYFRPLNAPHLPDWVLKEDKLPTFVPGLHPDPNLKFTTGVLKFIKFPRHQTSAFIDFSKKADLAAKFNIKTLSMTGGGAFKYAEEIKDKLAVTVRKLDEMETLIKGLNFLLENDIHEEVFEIDLTTKQQRFGALDHLGPNEYYPYILVNIGSGVSILKITSPTTYERISGTSLGGGTFWALCRLLTEANSWNEVQEMSQDGENENVDLLVGDIYGEEDNKYARLGLNKNVIASSLGKVATSHFEDGELRPHFNSKDLLRSLMLMFANNIGQISYLVAELHGIERLFFAGGFIEQSSILWGKLAYAINFWSQGKMKALFLRHNGYLGALGAIIHGGNSDDPECEGGEEQSF